MGLSLWIFFRPPPTRRIRPVGGTGVSFNSRIPCRITWRETPVAWDTTEIPPGPNALLSAATSNRLVRSSITGSRAANRCRTAATASMPKHSAKHSQMVMLFLNAALVGTRPQECLRVPIPVAPASVSPVSLLSFSAAADTRPLKVRKSCGEVATNASPGRNYPTTRVQFGNRSGFARRISPMRWGTCLRRLYSRSSRDCK